MTSTSPSRGITLVIEAGTDNADFHVHNLGIEEIFFTARNEYLGGLDVEDLWHQPVVPQLRELLTRFEAEVAQGTTLECTTMVTSRSRRAFVMEQTLVDAADATVMATCRSVQVTVAAGAAVEIPDALWHAVEARNGGPIPWANRPPAEAT